MVSILLVATNNLLVKTMNKLERKRLDLAIGYFAKNYYERLKKFPTQTQVYKYLAFVDFTSVKERGRPVFGLDYIAMKWGPVPIEIYEEFKNINKVKQYPHFKVLKKGNITEIAPLLNQKLNMDYFAEEELKLLDRFIEILVDKSNTSNHYSEASHQKIKAWKKAYSKKPNSKMNYLDEIEDSFLKEIFEGYLAVKSLLEG